MYRTVPILLLLLLLLSALWASGCAPTRPPSTDVSDPVTTVRPWSDVETWDVPPMDEMPVPANRDVNHAVPDSLMRSLADRGIAVERAGFRVQVFSSINRRETVETEERVLTWLESLSEEDLRRLGIRGAEDVYNVFASPYYRVRIGNFTTRNRAMALHDALSRTFPNVLVVPDRVRIVR